MWICAEAPRKAYLFPNAGMAPVIGRAPPGGMCVVLETYNSSSSGRKGSAPLHVRTPTECSVLEDQVARGHAALRTA